MEEKQINKWLRRKFSVVGWALVVYNIILNLLVVAALSLDTAAGYLRGFAAGDFRFEPDVNAVMGNAWGYILAIAAGLAVLYAWKGGDYWREEICRKEGKMTASAFFCLVILVAGAQMVSSLWIGTLETVMNQFDRSVLDLLESVSGDSNTFSMFLYSAILAPLSEEILFRGYVLRSLRPYGKRFAIFGSALLFALFHGNLLQAPYAFLAGLVLGYAAAEYSILWSVLLHMFNNLVMADFMTRLLDLLPEMAADIVSGCIFGAFAIAAVVLLIVKRREVKAYHKGEWMDRRCVTCFFTSSGVLVLMVMMGISMLSLFV